MLCGIDEAGRGPIAGPLVVAGVVLNKTVKELNDSKKLSEKKREELFDKIVNASQYHIVFKTNKQIDLKGISQCLKESIQEIMENISADEFLMDGNTSFGIQTLQHKIKADATVMEVSAASILAKVSRDRYMCKVSKKYPEYNFQKHKGYGTKAHVEKIKEFGRSELHRYSFKLKELGEEKGGIQKSLF
ncbi:ribonuclease HII [Arcobacter sp. CECT 8985]|uniref:ribonuclease HII n=1 Tax=Arcobacter sp. CECT 8985 TaxID=1935424 RepID=UPI00100B5F44|nr:ribonuclease HII [Arcobacter sp. CECT 8985]RXJ86601.1 ribonuclease HII [Arcobacter sp. CECT 8985]